MTKRNEKPIEECYPTIVIQFRAAQGNLPPDMQGSPADLVAFLAQGIAVITQTEQVNADCAYGMTSIQNYAELAEVLENESG